MIIYKIVHKATGKTYVGQTTQKLAERWWQHCHRSPSQTHRSHIFSAIQKYGSEAFSIEQIDGAGTLEGLNILEEAYIKKFNCLSPNGYNLHPGGRGKLCHPETKVKISSALKGRSFKNRWTKGNRAPRTDAQKVHLSTLNKGKPNVALYKRVVCVETREEYESVNAAAAAFRVNRVTISGLLKSGKKGRNGFSFRFVVP